MLEHFKYLFCIQLAICNLTKATWHCGGGQTIPRTKLCDGIVDCRNGRDETAKACVTNICKDNQYRCAYGGCLQAQTKCDGKPHCVDRSDETDLLCDTDSKVWTRIKGNCTTEQYQCQTAGECIDENALCDGRRDCSDESDETVQSCAHMICSNYSFRCAYGACISIEQVCNHIWDCVDGSDELCSIGWEIIQPERAGDDGDDDGGDVGRRRHQAETKTNHTCIIPYERAHLQVRQSGGGELLSYFDKISVGEVVQFRCSYGFELIGVERLTCMENNQWYRRWPNCTRSIPVPSPCSSSQISCDSGDCIARESLCDGTSHCLDGSDETAAKCLNRTCNSSQFQCKYGACVHGRKLCDDVQNCADASDETRLGCTKDDDGYYNILQGECDSTDDEELAACRSGECIPQSQICDGTAHCADRSDETVEMCAHMNCTNLSFTCAYGACVPSVAHCDGRVDCIDGSDEIEEMCARVAGKRAKHEEEYNFNDNYQANIDKQEAKQVQLITKAIDGMEQQSNNKQPKISLGGALTLTDTINIVYRHCTIPIDRLSLRAVLAANNSPLKLGSQVKIGLLVKFECADSKQLTVLGEPELLCLPRGVWSGSVPKCEKHCPALRKRISTNIRCTHQNKRVDCRNYQRIGTKAQFVCASGYSSSVQRAELLCGENGEWNGPILKCEPKCKMPPSAQLPQSQNAVLANVFELRPDPNNQRSRGKFTLAFNGTMISPKLVLTSSAFFSAGAIDPAKYAVLLLHINVAEFQHNEQNPHLVSDILLAPKSQRSHMESPALIVILDYFILNGSSVMPICLTFSNQCLRATDGRSESVKIDQRIHNGVAYLLDDCFVIIGQSGLIFMDEYQYWIETQIGKYEHLL